MEADGSSIFNVYIALFIVFLIRFLFNITDGSFYSCVQRIYAAQKKKEKDLLP